MLLAATKEALNYDENCFMIYLGPPQSSLRKEPGRLKIKEAKELLINNGITIDDIIVHAPYIINLAQSDAVKRNFAIDFLVREIKTMDIIGNKYLVVHPGSHMGLGIDLGIELISESLSEILTKTKDSEVVIAIETMAGKGNECCYRFEHIKRIMEKINNSRIKVCLDTCHIHDAGYDIINSYEEVLEEFDDLIGIKEIVVLHINDSLNICGSRKDRHANIGKGKIGFETLYKFVSDQRFMNIPKILETPYIKIGDKEYPPYKYEIEMLKKGYFNENIDKEIGKGD
ncbi:MAG: deoxyribonuclease IV [Candidatus Izemoplasmatales bacterium]|nr:deoxyribonuclease IV [Candidatus Izemoplasmatales bacterium]